MLKTPLVRIALLALLVFLFQVTRVLAGTTGVLTGNVILEDGTPVAGVNVTASSPSQAITTKTDSTGHFAFVSLVPDTYTVTVSGTDIETRSQPGLTVIADNTRTVTLKTKKVKTLGVVTVRGAVELVKPGTTADVYSINPTTAEAVETLGGGGGQGNAYSAIATVPGAVVPPNQYGWFQTVYVRGGDYDQIGYEFDGVPVLRTYDNYPTTNVTTLGQQELQVYTGAEPTNSQQQGLAGYINQVIKSGTYPAQGMVSAGITSPGFANNESIEYGGASPNRSFSYYLGFSGYDTSPHLLDNSDGAGVTSQWGTPWAFTLFPTGIGCAAGSPAIGVPGCYPSGVAPGGYVLAPYASSRLAGITDRENLINLHFGIPHHRDAGRDDIQLLYDWSELWTYGRMSAQDFGAANLELLNCEVGNTSACSGPGSLPAFLYANTVLYTGPLNAPFVPSSSSPSLFVNYTFPNQGNTGTAFSPSAVPSTYREGIENGLSIVKLQYQKNFSSNAYLRIYGYSFYSTWLDTGPECTDTFFVCVALPDYELANHSRGVSVTYANQFTPKHLVTIQGSLFASHDYRMNNYTGTFAGPAKFIRLVDSNNPDDGICYHRIKDSSGTVIGVSPVSCNTSAASGFSVFAGALGAIPPAPAFTCGSGPCEWLAVEDNANGGANLEKPQFVNASITDQFKPNEKWLFNFGVRYDRYSYKGSNTDVAPGPHNGSARLFWFNAWNQGSCVSPVPGSQPFQKSGDPSLPCPAGSIPATITDLPGFTETYTVWQPRIGGTYTIDPDNVLRFNYGRYAEEPNSAFQQYNLLQQNLPRYDGSNFYAVGFNTTSHRVPPATSDNVDASWEHRFKNSDTSFKLTPYLRKTQGQIQNFFLNQKQNFVSGLNCCNLTASGVEFTMAKGDFSRNGWSGELSYTYTSEYERYNRGRNNSTAISGLNLAIAQYNAYTSACAGNTTNPLCGGGLDTNGAVPMACYSAGSPVACSPGAVANPYWNAPPQPLFDENANYKVFSLIGSALESNVNAITIPHAATLIVNYRKDKLAFTPAFQFFGGGWYGAPLESRGIDPASGCTPVPPAATCTGTLGSGPVPPTDPRYPYGAAGGSPYDATVTIGTIAIPDPFTAKFDNFGAFRAPNQFLAHMQITYAATPRVTYKLNLNNLVSTCFGGDRKPWTIYSDRRVCGYILPGQAVPLPYVGNVYNPGVTFQPEVQFPYQQSFGTQPFNATFNISVKL